MKINNQKSLLELKAPGTKPNTKQSFSFKQAIDKMEASWMSVQNKSDRMISSLPAGVRPLLEMQLSINDLSLKAQMITRAGEAVASTMRKIQQFGG